MVTPFYQSTERNLILTGYVGPETPVLGRQIAERLRLPYANIEQQIADRVNLPVEDIRTYYGETRLKSIEMELIQEAALRRASVIRVSGRTLLHTDHFQRLSATGPVFCLVIALDAMLQKLHVNMGARYHDPSERGYALGELQREWAIRKHPGLVELDLTDMNTEEIIEVVTRRWLEQAIQRG